MRFWDTSALVPLLILERGTPAAARWLREDPVVIVWTLSRVELLSALARHRREAPKDAAILTAARRDLRDAWERWSEVTAVDAVRQQAERIVEIYPLKAADALQIGAALVAARQNPALHEFVTFDQALAASAEGEGLRVLSSP